MGEIHGVYEPQRQTQIANVIQQYLCKRVEVQFEMDKYNNLNTHANIFISLFYNIDKNNDTIKTKTRTVLYG